MNACLLFSVTSLPVQMGMWLAVKRAKGQVPLPAAEPGHHRLRPSRSAVLQGAPWYGLNQTKAQSR